MIEQRDAQERVPYIDRPSLLHESTILHTRKSFIFVFFHRQNRLYIARICISVIAMGTDSASIA